MPVKRFRSTDEARRDLYCFDPDERYYRSVAELWEIAN